MDCCLGRAPCVPGVTSYRDCLAYERTSSIAPLSFFKLMVIPRLFALPLIPAALNLSKSYYALSAPLGFNVDGR